jgi:broad specificity phosphatase PhoE
MIGFHGLGDVMQLYQPTLDMVRGLSGETHAGLVIRHSARFPILNDDEVYAAGLTQEGITQAERLGKALADVRHPGRLLSSPVGRCLDTAQAIARGAGWDLPVQTDYRLSHPFIERILSGPYIQWKEDPLPEALNDILALVLNGDGRSGGLDIFSTHDTVVAVLAGYFTGMRFEFPGYWPNFLEGVLIWSSPNRVHLKWREFETVLEPWPIKKSGQMELGF